MRKAALMRGFLFKSISFYQNRSLLGLDEILGNKKGCLLRQPFLYDSIEGARLDLIFDVAEFKVFLCFASKRTVLLNRRFNSAYSS
jgi:hypothetical protein